MESIDVETGKSESDQTVKDLLKSEKGLREKYNTGRFSVVEGWAWSSIRSKLGRLHGITVDRETGEVYEVDPETVPIFKMNGGAPAWAQGMKEAKKPHYQRID